MTSTAEAVYGRLLTYMLTFHHHGWAMAKTWLFCMFSFNECIFYIICYGTIKSDFCWQGLTFFTLYPFFTFNAFIPTYAYVACKWQSKKLDLLAGPCIFYNLSILYIQWLYSNLCIQYNKRSGMSLQGLAFFTIFPFFSFNAFVAFNW